ncbi:MAG: transporter multidrug efflux transporter [Amycolatopsis sp.]|uniref:MFS transporter n=1 Tax=Amycolatopsis sp. TaxID=37632 RepID=UPI00261546A4|nr:MFS transporter [Amycolatopsis sp.]MCU1681385.1 transporter multidrug efflux transporter [Amycolatopsis sp.]
MTEVFRTTTETGLDPRRWKALALLCVTNFMVILDSQIVILALPSIEKDLRLAPGSGQWVLSAYLVAFGGLLLFGGRLADLLGRRRMFLVGTALFGVSSLLCGAAWSGEMLIGARVVQGISAAMVAPAALSALMSLFPDGVERNKALGCWSAVGGLGATAALLIGGSLTGSLGWEWIFYLNLPVAAGMLVFGPKLLRESRGRAGAYDPVGAFTSTVGLMLLVGAIGLAPAQGWGSAPVLAMVVGALVLGGLFVVTERRSNAPLLPLRVFRSRQFTGGNLVMALIAMTAWGMGSTVSAYAQDVLAYSPLRFGLGTTAMTAMTIISAYAAQAVVAKAGIRTVASVGMVLMGTGAFLLTHVSPSGSYFADLFPGLVVFGLGLGGGPVAAISAALSSVGEQESGVASGVNTAAFQIGGALGTAITSCVVVSYGFQTGFTASVVFALIGLCVAFSLLRR